MTAHRYFGEGEIRSIPRRPAPAPSAEGFVVCPPPLAPQCVDAAAWMRDIYQLAYQQAKERISPPWHERNFCACPN